MNRKNLIKEISKGLSVTELAKVFGTRPSVIREYCNTYRLEIPKSFKTVEVAQYLLIIFS